MTHSTVDQSVQKLIQQIDRQHGYGTLIRLGDTQRLKVKTLELGIPKLDAILGGGLPQGRIVEIFGPEGAGKTTLALHAILQSQQLGGTAVFIDAEHALDPDYARQLGVDTDNLLIAQPDSGEMALTLIETLVESNAIALIVVDSVAALIPEVELSAEIGDHLVGIHSRLMSKALRRLVARFNATQSNCIVIFTNQLRYIQGVVYGSPETTTGGRALRFYASVRLDVRRIQTLKRGTDEYGIVVKVKTVKNKVATPFRSVELNLQFGRGFVPDETLPLSQSNPQLIPNEF
jgi:recombination protein RecA